MQNVEVAVYVVGLFLDLTSVLVSFVFFVVKYFLSAIRTATIRQARPTHRAAKRSRGSGGRS